VAQSGSVRARVRAAIVGTVALALLLMGLPLGAALSTLYRGQAETRLEGEAARVLVNIPQDLLGPTTPLPRPRYPHITLGLYDAAGTRLAGSGPASDDVARQAARRRMETRGVVGDELEVALPFRRDNGGTFSVRAASPYGEVVARTYRSWALMALLAAAVLGIAWLVGSRRARALALPFEQLTADAQALGRGDFGVRVQNTGLAEADAAGIALGETATRLGAMLERERAFSADASHQLRTPLTRLRLGLESALLDPAADRDVALQDAVTRLDELERTVRSLLMLARDTGSAGGRCDAGAVVRDMRVRWFGAADDLGRSVHVQIAGDVPEAACSAVALGQVLDVLVDNALAHGAGNVLVAVRPAGPGVAVDVCDEGPGLGPDPERAFLRRSPDARGHGIGLALARSLTEAEGGRLVVTAPGPRPVLSVLLPAAEGDA
jgi:signal transduction histidine kinase